MRKRIAAVGSVPMKLALAVLCALALGGCPLPFQFSPKGWPSAVTGKDPSTPSITAAPDVVFTESNGGSGSLSNGQTGNTSSDTLVRFSSDTVGAVIYYTLDGSTPDPRSSNTNRYVPTSPLNLSIVNPTALNCASSLSVTAAAIGPNMKPSLLTRATISLQYPRAAAPDFSLDPGVYSTDQNLTMSSATSGAEIYYIMTDGPGPVPRPVPGQAGTVHYTGSVSLTGPSNTWTVSAIAVKDQMIESAVTLESFTISWVLCAPPTFDPPSSILYDSTPISIESTAGSTIYYTIDGKDPIPGSSPSVTSGGSFFLNRGEDVTGQVTVRAIAVPADPLMTNSIIQPAYYTFRVMDIVPSIEGGTYDTPHDVGLSCGTTGATIYVRTDGGDPLSGTVYPGPMVVSDGMQLRAMAIKDGYVDSALLSEDYTLKVRTPVFNQRETVYYEPLSVDFEDPVPSHAEYFFTLDGSPPGLSSETWTPGTSIPIPNGTTTTVRVIGMAGGFQNSEVAEWTYSVYQTPTGFKVGWANSTEMDVSWDALPGVKVFVVESATSPDFSSPPIVDSYTSTSSTSFAGLTPSTRYYFRIRAVYDDGGTDVSTPFVESPNYWGATLNNREGFYFFNVNLATDGYSRPFGYLPYFRTPAGTDTQTGRALRQGGYTFIGFGNREDGANWSRIVVYDSNKTYAAIVATFENSYLFDVDLDSSIPPYVRYWGEGSGITAYLCSDLLRSRW